MPLATQLIRNNIARARYSLPFLSPSLRDLMALIPALLAAGEPICGVYGHAFSSSEKDLLRTYTPSRANVPVERLPDKIVLESVIAVPRPSFAHTSHVSLHLVVLPQETADEEAIHAKLEDIRLVLEDKGLHLVPYIARLPLGPQLCHDIMRVGIVLAGRHPVTRSEEVSELSIDIGPAAPVLGAHLPDTKEWDPFSQTLADEVRHAIETQSYPALFAIPGANPYLLPYLTILNRYEEDLDADRLEKIRVCIYYLFSAFPPTRAVIAEQARAWKLPELEPFERLSFKDAMHLRLWLIPAEKDELPIFAWPPLPAFQADEVHLQQQDAQWSLAGKAIIRHRYPWVVLAWGALTGLIGTQTYIHRHSVRLRRDAIACLLRMVAAVDQGADIIVPPDHTQGSIRRVDHRLHYSDQPFALLERGTKHSLDLDEPVIKKAALDDTGIEQYLKRRGD